MNVLFESEYTKVEESSSSIPWQGPSSNTWCEMQSSLIITGINNKGAVGVNSQPVVMVTPHRNAGCCDLHIQKLACIFTRKPD